MSSRETGFYNWADDAVVAAAVAPQSLPAPYVPPGLPAVVPSNVRVVQIPGQLPVYAYEPQRVPYDPRPALMYGCGVMMFGIGGGAGLAGLGVGYGCDLMFTGMAHATDAIIGIAVAVVAAVVGIVAMKVMGGTRVSIRQGDNSTFSASR